MKAPNPDWLPGSTWWAAYVRPFCEDVDLNDNTFHNVQKGTLILILAGPFTYPSRPRLNRARFWLLIDGRPFYDTLPVGFLEPVTP